MKVYFSFLALFVSRFSALFSEGTFDRRQPIFAEWHQQISRGETENGLDLSLIKEHGISRVLFTFKS
jgi:hypothetical protein